MSRLRELVDELCPDGVEYKTLGDLLSYEQPGKYIVKSTNYDDSYETPVLTAGQAFILGFTAEKDGLYDASTKHPVIIFDDFTTSYHWVDFSFKVKSSAMKMLTAKDENLALFKYIFYAMQQIDYTPGEHARQWISVYSKFRIPVPPIEVQREVVRILDSFQELDDALTAEIEAREKQLEGLRQELTANSHFDDDCLMPLSEAATFSGGHTPSKAVTENYAEGQSGISWVTSKDVKGERLGVSQITLTQKGAEELRLYPAGTTVMVTRSGILRHYLPIASLTVESTVNQDIRCICAKEGVLDDYLFEVLKARADYMLRTFFNLGGTVDSIDFNRVKTMVVPIPSMEAQTCIVYALNPLEQLLVSLIAERDARRKQFEHYRDKLLSLPEKEA